MKLKTTIWLGENIWADGFEVTFDDYKKLPDGFILYKNVSGEKVIKSADLKVFNLSGLTGLSFLESQIPTYRTSSKAGSYLPIQMPNVSRCNNLMKAFL